MANEEHVRKLRSGAEAWRRWREENATIRPDLDSVVLSGANLEGVNLSEAHLFGAELSGANLSHVDLSSATLSHAMLDGASLSHAMLFGANLSVANLSRANLSGANLNGAVLYHSVFGDANLTSANGLDSCIHVGPCIIDHQTLIKSGKLPIEFLRGCGLPDFIIDNVSVLQGDPLQFYSCFISHSSKDKEFAERLHNDLQGKGVRCWYAPEDLKIGDRFRDRINEAIRVHDKLLLILSEHSVASDWVEAEVEKALAEERRRGKAAPVSETRPTVLFPVRLDDAALDPEMAWAEHIRNTRHIGDFTRWKDHDAYQRAFDRLLSDLEAGA